MAHTLAAGPQIIDEFADDWGRSTSKECQAAAVCREYMSVYLNVMGKRMGNSQVCDCVMTVWWKLCCMGHPEHLSTASSSQVHVRKCVKKVWMFHKPCVPSCSWFHLVPLSTTIKFFCCFRDTHWWTMSIFKGFFCFFDVFIVVLFETMFMIKVPMGSSTITLGKVSACATDQWWQRPHADFLRRVAAPVLQCRVFQGDLQLLGPKVRWLKTVSLYRNDK